MEFWEQRTIYQKNSKNDNRRRLQSFYLWVWKYIKKNLTIDQNNIPVYHIQVSSPFHFSSCLSLFLSLSLTLFLSLSLSLYHSPPLSLFLFASLLSISLSILFQLISIDILLHSFYHPPMLPHLKGNSVKEWVVRFLFMHRAADRIKVEEGKEKARSEFKWEGIEQHRGFHLSLQ